MRFDVIALPPAEYEAWAEAQQSDPAISTGAYTRPAPK